MRVILVVAVSLAASGGALALPGVMPETPGARACYARVYDARHLAAHPSQRTTAMRVSFRRERIAGAIASVPPLDRIRIEVSRRGVSQPLRAIGDCSFSPQANRDVEGRRRIASVRQEAGIVCAMALDASDEGGGAEPVLVAAGESLTVHMDESLPMRRSRRLSDGPSQLIAFAGADGVFRLQRTADGACDALDEAIVAE